MSSYPEDHGHPPQVPFLPPEAHSHTPTHQHQQHDDPAIAMTAQVMRPAVQQQQQHPQHQFLDAATHPRYDEYGAPFASTEWFFADAGNAAPAGAHSTPIQQQDLSQHHQLSPHHLPHAFGQSPQLASPLQARHQLQHIAAQQFVTNSRQAPTSNPIEQETGQEVFRPPKRKASESLSPALANTASFQLESRQSSSASTAATQPTLFSNLGGSTSSAHTSPSILPTSVSTVSISAGSTTSSTGRSFTPIAPDPVGLQRIQAIRQNQKLEEAHEASRVKRRRTAAAAAAMENQGPPTLREEDRLLLSLKDDQSLPWKDIASKFEQETGKVHMIPALQMRYKRLKERLQVWTESDLEALRQAHDYWESRKFDIISAKMLEYGATDKFSPKSCQRKWQEMHPTNEYMQQVPMAQHPYHPPSASPQSHSPYVSAPYPAPGMYATQPGPYSSPHGPGHQQPQHHHGSMSGYGSQGSPGVSLPPPQSYMQPGPQGGTPQRVSNYPPVSQMQHQQGGHSYWT